MTLADTLKATGVVIKRKTILKSGLESNIYFDVRKACASPKVLKQLATALAKLISKNATCIAAEGYGGLPLATLIAQIRNLPLALVRDKPKQHGTGQTIDGYIPTAKDRVAIIDDVYTKGTSIRHTASVIAKTKAKLIDTYVIIDRSGKKLAPVKSLFTLKDFN